MTTITKASNEWRNRPADQRYTSLLDMRAAMQTIREQSRAVRVDSRALRAVPMPDHVGMLIEGANGVGYAPTHYALGQLAGLAGAPAGYLRSLPSELAADCLNYGLQVERDGRDVGVLISKTDAGPVFRAATGPSYGRIWNCDVISALVDRVGDGVSGHWRVPGEFGKRVEVTKANTTLFASDRDMFVFLADEDRRIEIPNRRDGQPGSMARGFFVWNSEVGSSTLGIATFLFDYVCCNRIVWGASDYHEIRIRHSSGAPDRWFGEVLPLIERYAAASDAPVINAIEAARDAKIDAVEKFLASRWTRSQADAIQAAHLVDEGRPIETVWDVVVGATAYARDLPNNDERLTIERAAGALLKAA